MDIALIVSILSLLVNIARLLIDWQTKDNKDKDS